MLKALAAGLLVAALALLWPNQEPASAQARVSDPDRGMYLVHHVAKCISCHSPRNSRGELDYNRLLRGAPIPVRSPFPNEQWAFQAPAIAGLPGWSTSDAVHLLTQGSRPGGYVPRSPMPQYRMTLEDAEAVVAYLKSLR